MVVKGKDSEREREREREGRDRENAAGNVLESPERPLTDLSNVCDG